MVAAQRWSRVATAQIWSGKEIPLERRYPTSKLSGGSREEILTAQFGLSKVR